MTTGVLISKKQIVAPADDFIIPFAKPFLLPEKAQQTSNGFYCHDQGMKKNSHISLISEFSQKTDESEQLASRTRIKISKVLNELNFDGTNTIDGFLCHKVEHGAINPKPTIATLILSNRAVSSLPINITTAKTWVESNHSEEGTLADSLILTLRNNALLQSDLPSVNPSLEHMSQLIDTARLIQLFEESKSNHSLTGQPSAFLTRCGDKYYLRALVNEWELIDELPNSLNLPVFAKKHPYISKLLWASSPITGTFWHTFNFTSLPNIDGGLPGILVTSEIIGTSTVAFMFVRALSTYPLSYGILNVSFGLLFARGFYNWWISKY